VKFGTFHLFSVAPWTNPADAIDHEFEQMVLADQLGYDELWLAEHNARRYGIVGSTQLSAAALARATTRIRIGTAVTRLPLHHPLHLAEDLAFVDNLSGGRLDWGVGKGYDPLEFSTYGVPFEEREERWQETFQAVCKIWETGRTGHEGRFYTIPDEELFPLPSQRPIPPIYLMVSRSDSSVIWGAERLYPMVLGQGPEWDDAKHKMELYGETASKAGHSTADIQNALSRCWQLKQVHIAETAVQAESEYQEGLLWYFSIRDNRVMFGFSREQKPYEYYLQHRSVIVGTPAKVLEDFQEYREYTGIQNVIPWFNCGGQPQQQVIRALRTFAEEVMPKLKDASSQQPVQAAPAA
jgi:alkanesulfonate monooxygenase SsuD/methylene tetrahydromethanopterin reductase-like flavin-dependent oxidoreductase (luciferase family)